MSHTDSLTSQHFEAITRILYENAGITMAQRKRRMVENRIAKRVQELALPSFSDYLSFLESKQNKSEIVHLVNALTTNVTHFFREEHHFQHLSAQVGHLLQNRATKIRIWSAGCSIGAEPYSAAITLLETMKKYKQRSNIRILATDIDTMALARARKGDFHEKIIKGLPRSHLLSYFNPRQQDNETIYTVNKDVRNLVAYNYLNFNTRQWPMSGPFDFIFCRNALIYFKRDKQNEYVSKMSNLLKPGGFLYLGHSEHSVMEGRDFKICGQTIYQKL